MPDHPVIVPAEAWDEDENGQDGAAVLGPAGIEDAIYPMSAIAGQPVLVLVNDRYRLEDLPGVMLASAPLARISAVLRCLFRLGEIAATAMISDGNTSHAVAPNSMDPEDLGRLVYFDPWNQRSFLQQGFNTAGVCARPFGPGLFSVAWKQFEAVLVALAISLHPEKAGVFCRLPFDDLKSTDFWRFFHLRERGSRAEGQNIVITAKPGGFQQYIDLEFVLGPAGLLEGASLILSREWIAYRGLNPFAIDLVKSLIPALIAPEVEFRGRGDSTALRIPNPELRLARYLSDSIYGLLNQEETRNRFARRTRTNDNVLGFLAAFLGRLDSATLPLLFSSFQASNAGGAFKLAWRVTPPAG